MNSETCLFSTKHDQRRNGGLIVCGLNYGLPIGGIPMSESLFEPWADYFSHDKNHDRFSGRIKLWFEQWGHPFSANAPGILDHAISQTNLFYTATRSLVFDSVEQPELTLALRRLFSGATLLDASGLIITCSRIMPALSLFLNLDANTWRRAHSGRMHIAFAETGPLNIAVCPHPRYPLSYQDAQGLRPAMQLWIENVINQYTQKQRPSVSVRK